ncbi:hypothetical protein HAX54_004028 [Datura stramonium]|uniref:Uncharacterized protein n=1 Tax=Datura stramonium TaxID=4076 RepID=A0ABS8T7I7_DATST|nr:hypothetical protein [Datura stramonium]
MGERTENDSSAKNYSWVLALEVPSRMKQQNGRTEKKPKKIAATGIKSFQEGHESYLGETSDEESEGEDGENENLTLMARSDTDSDNDSTEASLFDLKTQVHNLSKRKVVKLLLSLIGVRAPTQNEGTVKETDFVSVPSGSGHELKNSRGTNPETVGYFELDGPKFDFLLGILSGGFAMGKKKKVLVGSSYAFDIFGYCPQVIRQFCQIWFLSWDHELLCTKVRDLHAQIERNEEAAARHIVLVALIMGLSQPTIPFIFSITQPIPDPSPSTS